MEYKTVRVYPTFSFACGAKSAAMLIFFHCAIIMLLFHYGLANLQHKHAEIGLVLFSDTNKLMFAGLASLVSYALTELLLTTIFIKKLSKPLVITKDVLIIPKWAIKYSASYKSKQSLRVVVNEITGIKTRFFDTSKIPILRQAIPLPMTVQLAMGTSSITLDLKHVGFFKPINNWLKSVDVPILNSETKVLPDVSYVSFNGVFWSCCSLSLIVAFVMPLLLWVFSP
ncbi:hypothetical protein [Arsukibacterium tuosuense]|uniref:hypothetical protein n=1 Tax=Arsukibacterium tuosuense TaxID=1323745 RepID=UPI000BE25EAB|nr:hypothetical protein [Arsukibacterium tuosuense]